MPWLVLFLFCVAVGLPNVILEENVGCLFSDRLCLENEWCFDDYAFGRCLSSTDINNDDLYRYDLNKGELNKISSELRRLFTLGYRWSHLYTQCRLQAILYSIRYDTSFDNNACTHLVDQDLEGALNALENDDTINPDEIAIVKYAPNSEHSNSNFADEIYYPPVDNIPIRDNNILPHDAVIDLHELENPYVGIDKRDEWIPQMHRRSSSLEFLNQDPIINNDKQNYEDIQYLLDALQLKQNDNPYWNFPEQRIYDQGDNDEINNNEYGSGFNEIFRERQNPMIYTEGGTVQMKTQDRNKFYDNFKRMERLDVKKPGPQISQTLMKLIKNDDTFVPSMIKKEPRGVHPNPFHDLYSDVDTDYVYVKFQNSLNTWKEGEYIIANISRLLHLESTAFTYGRVDRNEVTFKVVPNSRGFNSSEVARRIEFISDKLEEKTGVKVIAAGIGNRNKMQSIVVTKLDQVENEYYVIIFLVAGVLGATILAAVFLILIKKTIRNRIKLSGLSRPESEAGKDYQDLCRARMATKNDPVGRITCLSKESESSRSSTSSWSEEPALNNMDISTGHMVLSYMEDHLKNKDRLDQEWVALCAYIAEPCETTIALKKENISKNRYKDIIPYDHSRVVLNELSNGSNSDYINASTITDHDPRNPAYIATQGPLTHTCPDFWQMIWEQGAVVIVMLTRLTEGGTTMCHRYWPEEGSELYNIYEVHLVSEHIWCDDYLVRSFYLKNVKTSETRTVTQFHFLSWPESGIPASTKALLEFRRKVNKSYRGRSSPIVVHCNDGTGRSGTYCLIDMVLSRMAKGAKEIDIAATLEHLRDQRLKMVANKQQFEFVLTAVAEEVHAILKALPPQPTFTQTDK